MANKKSGKFKIFPMAFLKNQRVENVADGALNITSGTTNIAAGSTKYYSSVTIASGATLNITGSGVLKIYCRGDFDLSGSVTATGYESNGTPVSFTGLGTDAPPTPYSHPQSQAQGGSGGSGTGGLGGGSGGSGSNGFGGGGGGGGADEPQVVPPIKQAAGFPGGTNNGNGTSSPPSFPAVGGTGNQTNGNGTSVPSSTQGGPGGGSGGGAAGEVLDFILGSPAYWGGTGGSGGGHKGNHKPSLYLYIEGNLTGSGSINLSGQNGFNGGTSSPSSWGYGGGGGGGGGGSAGKLWIRSRASKPPGWTLTTSGGSGGSGGSGANSGQSGQSGQSSTPDESSTLYID